MNKEKAYGICLYKITKQKKIKVLLCKSVNSKQKWGFLKGVSLKFEQNKRCAQREFFEESGIFVDIKKFEEYFEQKNPTKDIGIYLVNYDNVNDVDEHFLDDDLISDCISKENSKVKFFDLKQLPKIRSKQKKIAYDIKDFLQNKSPLH
jgi:ADP-ribose pyrophosphatase YjhB (NUDIX family)